MEQISNDMIDSACSDDLKIELAKASEDASFALKNRFLHDKNTMKFAKKEKMPVEVTKVRDMLRNQHVFRAKTV